MMRKGDKILIVVIAAVIAVGYGAKLYNDTRNKGAEIVASIEVNGKVYGEYDLETVENNVFELELPDGQHSVVEFSEGKVRIKEANCPDKVCVRTGWASKPGEIIVCLPYRVIIKVSGTGNDIDVKTN